MMHGKHIAVVGAGPAGLAAASYLLADGFNVTILERKSGPGGVWNTNPGNSRWPSPVYDGLTTNVPRNLMTFTDHPWDPSTPLFPTSGEVNQYLEKYAQRIRMYCNSENKLEIRYNCWVTDVRKSAELGDFGWRVRVSQYRFDQPLPEEQIAVTFAAVVIAVGNYNTAFAPDHPGQSEWHLRFPNSMIHAISYRQAQDYRDKNVLVIGNSASGWDISLQLAGVAKQVIVSSSRYKSDSPQQMFSSPQVHGAPGILYFTSDDRSVTFKDGRSAEGVDHVIFCTGYEYDMSFIKKSTSFGDETMFPAGLQVPHVYDHIFYMQDPTLAFVGLPTMSASFTIPEAQSALIARAWSGRVPMKDLASMEAWEASEIHGWLQNKAKGNPAGYHAFMLKADKDYINALATRVEIEDESEERRGKPAPYFCHCFETARASTGEVRQKYIGKRDGGNDMRPFTSFASLGVDVPSSCEIGALIQASPKVVNICSCYIF